MKREDYLNHAKKIGYTCNFETGDIFKPNGELITNKNNCGYIFFTIKYNKQYKNIFGHLFIWFMYHGCDILDGYVTDHINLIKTDNRISNLRMVTPQQNQWNRKAKGYFWDKTYKKWKARITCNKNVIYLGLYDTEEEAHNAYLEAKKIYHKI